MIDRASTCIGYILHATILDYADELNGWFAAKARATTADACGRV